MRAAWYHLRRYSCWAVFGMMVFALPLVPLSTNNFKRVYGAVLIAAGTGAFIFVVLRAAMGAITGWPPTKADRAVAIGLRGYFVGWLLVLLIVLPIIATAPGTPRRIVETNAYSLLVICGLAILLNARSLRKRQGWSSLLRKAWYHFRRYAAWAAFGVLVFTLPTYMLHMKDGRYLILTALGGLCFVVPRLLVSMFTQWTPRSADRVLAIATLRFFVGLLAGLVLSAVLSYLLPDSGRSWSKILLAVPPASAVVMVSTGWVISHRRGWLILLFAWAAVIALILGAFHVLAR